MANFLALSQKLASESGTFTDTKLTAVSTTDPRGKKLVRWIADAWRQIQNSRDWRWMQAEFTSGALAIGQQRYTATELGIASRFGHWLVDERECADSGFSLYDNAIGVSDEGPLVWIDWDRFYQRYTRGTITNGKPTGFTVTPDDKIGLTVPPDSTAYRIRGRYVKSPQELSADADIPEMPVRFHDAIVEVALMLVGAHDESPQLSIWQMRKSATFSDLERDQLPKIKIAGALA